MTNHIYCTYLTTYSGNKLPPFYIGSTSLKRIAKGYRGSVASKEYINIWQSELRNNPHLFSTKVITTHATRAEAAAREGKFHLALKVVPSPLYINKCNADDRARYSGIDQMGSKNPMFGKKHSAENKLRWSMMKKDKPKTESTRAKMKQSRNARVDKPSKYTFPVVFKSPNAETVFPNLGTLIEKIGIYKHEAVRLFKLNGVPFSKGKFKGCSIIRPGSES